MSNGVTPEKTGENPNNNDLDSSSQNREVETMTGDAGNLDLSDPAEPGTSTNATRIGSSYSAADKLAYRATNADKRLSYLGNKLSETLSGEETFFNFLFCLEEQSQTSPWREICTITSLKGDKYHIFKDFVNLTDADITSMAEARWITDPDAKLKMNDTLSEQFYSRVLLKIIRDSTSVELRKEIHNEIPANLT
jgi:hypothetical protein